MERGPAAGEVQLLDGYFVHFTAPEKLTPMAKHVVFVLDTSGSMRHRKMHQTIAAMVTILGDMRPEDSLTIVSFATEVTVWEGGSVVAASEDNIARAVRYVETLEAKGETNINGALLRALEILQEVRDTGARSELQPMVFFLTDGHPTVGETDTLAILDNIKTANANIGAPIFSLAFGRRTDFQMLRLLSVQNHGFARKIYTAADASLQMAGFYKEVSSPILSNVTFDYLSSDIIHSSLTETAFHTFYQGGEMVVAGMVDTHQHAVDTMVMPVFKVRQLTMDFIFVYNYRKSCSVRDHGAPHGGRVPRDGRHGGGRGDGDGGHLHRPGAQLQHVLLQLHGAHVGLPQRARAPAQGRARRAVQLRAGAEAGKLPGVCSAVYPPPREDRS